MHGPENEITEPVIGLRRWSVTDEGELYSPIIEGPWDPGINEAKCIKTRLWQPWHHRGAAPVAGCTCGLYAHHETAGIDSSGVWGVVKGWGRVQVHQDGWRSQYAELIAIFNRNHEDTLLQKVAARYNVPILPPSFQDGKLLESEFGSFVPKEIRPKRDTDYTEPANWMVADYALWASLGTLIVGTVGLGVVRQWRQLKS